MSQSEPRKTKKGLLMQQFVKKLIMVLAFTVVSASPCTEQKSNEKIDQAVDRAIERALLGIHVLTSYNAGVTDAIKSQARREMRKMYREYTLRNKTTGYIYTCGYANEILAEGAKQGLKPEDVMNLAHENVELFSESFIANRKNKKMTKADEESYAVLAERAILIRQLIYTCGQQQGLFSEKQAAL